jgi:M6 family metalloprotease-like protein
LKESEEVRNSKFQKRYALMIPPEEPVTAPEILRTLGPNQGLLAGRRVSEGNVKGLTVLVQFQDVKSSVTAADVSEMLNDIRYSGSGNFCSVREYYRLMSNGKLDYTNLVVGPITLKRNLLYYADHALFKEALDAVVEMGIDLAQFDSRGEGIIDALSFLYAGQTQYNGWLWPHNHVLSLQYGKLKTLFYTISSMGRTRADLSIGTACHELGHMLCRFPDLYDYGERDGDFEKSAGLGRYCLMSAGNHNNYGRTPSPICAYLRYLVGWCDKVMELNSPEEYQAKHGDYGSALVFRTENLNEYFLVENRSSVGLDCQLPSGGLAVYHCDTLGSNEWQGGTASKHYQCGLLQADGHFDLENNRNQGDVDDLFKRTEGIAITHSTLPNSNRWDGSESGLTISKIGDPGEVIVFTVGTAPSAGVIRGKATPGATIPDNDPTGMRSAITIAEADVIRKIKVSVDITHTYIGDLSMELIAPSGTRANLHNRGGASQDNLITTFDSDSNANLLAMVGQSTKGDWTLWVSDLAKRDVGKLNKWEIEIEPEATLREISKESKPVLDIPDNDPKGVGDVISIGEEGSLERITVSVDISHTYIGDLRVELFAPAGKQAVLHNRTGSGKDNLVATYESAFVASLAAFVGQPIKGNWILRVTDLAGRDVGKLNGWSLLLSYRG